MTSAGKASMPAKTNVLTLTSLGIIPSHTGPSVYALPPASIHLAEEAA
jgi:hypothetical protein